MTQRKLKNFFNSQHLGTECQVLETVKDGWSRTPLFPGRSCRQEMLGLSVDRLSRQSAWINWRHSHCAGSQAWLQPTLTMTHSPACGRWALEKGSSSLFKMFGFQVHREWNQMHHDCLCLEICLLDVSKCPHRKEMFGESMPFRNTHKVLKVV